VSVGPNVAVEYMIVGVGVGVPVSVGVNVGDGGVYIAVWVSKKDATIVPTAEVIKTSGFSGGASPPVQAVKMIAIRVTMIMLVEYFFIRVSDVNLSQNYTIHVGEIPTLKIRIFSFFIEQGS
jgi:hypothetical protein